MNKRSLLDMASAGAIMSLMGGFGSKQSENDKRHKEKMKAKRRAKNKRK